MNGGAPAGPCPFRTRLPREACSAAATILSLRLMNSWSNVPGLDSSRRRSQRVILSVPVTVSGEASSGPFSEDTVTLVVNAHGALVALGARLSQGQRVQIKSRARSQQQAARVSYVGPTVDGNTQFGIEFATPAPAFWGIAFPPEDWASAVVPDPPLKKPGK